MAAALSDEAKAARRAYNRKRYREDPERQKEANRRYWERKAAAMAAEENKDKKGA